MANPAVPILASNIWLSQQDRMYRDATEPFVKKRRLGTGLKAVDIALGEGLDYGKIHCITSEPSQSTEEVVRALLVAHILSSPAASATVIDSTLAFDVRGLYRAAESSLQKSKDAKEEALRSLDRLKIMKVFDYVGLTDAVTELDESIEASRNVEVVQAVGNTIKSTIADSEDENEDEDEMLDAASPAQQVRPVSSMESERRLLVIDSISQVMTPLIKNNYTQGQALLSAFMRSLGHITRQHGLCTVLVSSSSNKAAPSDEALSLFKACTIRPALGVGFAQLVDVQLYLHSLPTDSGAQAGKHGQGTDRVSVLEVVQDRYDARLGRWAPFVRGDDGRLEEMI